MNQDKKEKLAALGWQETTVQEFLGLTPEELKYIELKLALSKKLKAQRKEKKLSQVAFAAQIGSSQSRVAKMEKGDPTVSIDLLIKSLFALDTTKGDIAKLLLEEEMVF